MAFPNYEYRTPDILNPQVNPTIYQPIGDNATTEAGFKPSFSQQKLRKLIALYKKSPKYISQKTLDNIQKHAVYYNIPFYKGDFSIVGALKELGKGFFSGFTTLNIGDAPDNEYEAVVRNIGHLLGFAPGLMAKPLKLLGLHNKAAAVAGIRSVPMRAADYITKQAKGIVKPVMGTAIRNRAAASGTVAKFMTTGGAKHVVEGAFHLGVASAVSNWQQSVDDIVHAGVGGAEFGGAFALLGNIVPGKGGSSYLLRALAGSLYQGLPATQRGATTPEQVYEYVLGAYFGGGAVGWKQKKASEFFTEKTKQAYGVEGKKANNELKATNNPELVKGWRELDPLVKKEVIEQMNDPKNKELLYKKVL
jgi:hypothetical protein